MELNIDSVSLKVKNNFLVLKTGLIVEETIAKIPLEIVPHIKWDKTVETILIQELIRKKRLDIVLQMSGHQQEPKAIKPEFVKESFESEHKPTNWQEDKK